jgi:mono/diheme cytochrome c family protein
MVCKKISGGEKMRNKTYILIAFVMVLFLILAACGGGGDEQASTNGCTPEEGEALFAQTVIGSQPGCITCHSVEEGVVIVGPSMAGIANRAATTVDGVGAAEYIETSILTPDGYLVEGFAAGTMPQVWDDELSDEQVQCLVAYLLTLK